MPRRPSGSAVGYFGQPLPKSRAGSLLVEVVSVYTDFYCKSIERVKKVYYGDRTRPECRERRLGIEPMGLRREVQAILRKYHPDARGTQWLSFAFLRSIFSLLYNPPPMGGIFSACPPPVPH